LFKLGIIGCGRIVEAGHVKAFALLGRDVRVVAVSDVVGNRADVIGETLGVSPEHRYTDYRRMLRREALDFVDVALPHFLHKRAVIDSAKAGVHIITEKPLAVNLREVDAMLAAVEKAGVELCVLHNYRYTSPKRAALRLIKRGVLGDVFFTRMERLSGGHWPGAAGYDPAWRTKSARAGGGCLIDNGYHTIYLAREAMDSPVTRVYAHVATHLQPIDVEDLAVLTLEHDNGGVSVIQSAWSIKGPSMGGEEFHGTRGSLRFGFEGHPVAVHNNKSGKWTYPQVPKQYGGESFASIMHDCFKAVREGGRVPTDGWEARRNLEVVVAAYKSAKTGRAVTLPPPARPCEWTKL